MYLQFWCHGTTYPNWRTNCGSNEGTRPGVDLKKRIHSKDCEPNENLVQNFQIWSVNIFLTESFTVYFVLTCSILLVNSHNNFEKVSTWKKRQQNKKIFRQLNGSCADLTIGQSNHETQTECRANIADRSISSNIVNGPIEINSPQVNRQTHLRKTLLVKYEVKRKVWWRRSKLESKTQYWLW